MIKYFTAIISSNHVRKFHLLVKASLLIKRDNPVLNKTIKWFSFNIIRLVLVPFVF